MTAPPGSDAGATGSPQTLWIWLLVALPVICIIPMLFIDLRSIADSAYQGVLIGDAAVTLAIYTEPAYLSLYGIVAAAMLVSIPLAVLDRRALAAHGVPRPFHWAFILLVFVVGSLPYVIGRDVVARRRTGRWSGAAWVAIALAAAGLIGVVVYVLIELPSVLALLAYR